MTQIAALESEIANVTRQLQSTKQQYTNANKLYLEQLSAYQVLIK
jgi:hypothetical protein